MQDGNTVPAADPAADGAHPQARTAGTMTAARSGYGCRLLQVSRAPVHWAAFQFRLPKGSWTTVGFRAINARRACAGPFGFLRPCSQFSNVLLAIPIPRADSAWDRPVPARTFATSMSGTAISGTRASVPCPFEKALASSRPRSTLPNALIVCHATCLPSPCPAQRPQPAPRVLGSPSHSWRKP